MIKDIDTILYVRPPINEGEYADRYTGSTMPGQQDRYGKGSVNYDDPRLYSSNAFGKSLQSELNGMGGGFSAEVTDFGKWVTAKVNYHDFVTGRTSSKTFLVVFSNKSKGIVLSTANKWRTIDGYVQAASYIKSASQALRNSSSQKI